MVSSLLSRLPENGQPAMPQDVNRWFDVLGGNNGGGILLTGHDGTRRDNALSTNYALDVSSQATGGLHAAFPLKATAASVQKTVSNSAVLITDAGVLVGAAKLVSLYATGGVNHADLSSDASGGLVLGGSGANAGLLSLAALATTGDITASGNLIWKSGTAFKVTLDHTATADRVLTVPDATDTLALLVASQTLTNKTLTNPTINGAALSGSLTGTPTFSNAITFADATSPIIAAKLGPTSARQHTLPNVASDTIALLAATQTLANKTLDSSTTIQSPTMTGTWQAPAISPPTTDGQVTRSAVAKGWVNFSISGTTVIVNQSYNLTSVTRAAAGAYTITWDRDFSGANNCILATPVNATLLCCTFTSNAAGTCTLLVSTAAGVATDPSSVSVVAYGALL